MYPGPYVCVVITLVAEDGFAWQTVASTLVYLAAHMNWDDKMNAKKLPTLLEGEAIAVWF